MKIVLRQEFPLGRFHATPWRVNPFDDPHGEWPPSPWRLVRAVTARWYQWARESEHEPDLADLERLQAAMCKSTYAFHLPADARRGSPLRQYHPTGFGMDPPNWRHVARYQRPTGSTPMDHDEAAPTPTLKKSKGRVSHRKQGTPEETANKQAKEKVRGLKGPKLSESRSEGKPLIEWEVTIKDKGADDTKKKLEAILGAPSTPWQRVADAGARGYGTSLIQDNYWCVPPEFPVWWFIEGDEWTDELRTLLAQCVERVTYFGRAETFTRVRLAYSNADIPTPNCKLIEKRTAGAVPVLAPLENATRDDIERTTDHPEALQRAVPPGTHWQYATRPARAASRERRRVSTHRPDCHLMQFALGYNVAPDPRAIVRLTSRFRGAVLHELLRLKTGDASATWTRVTRDAVADMLGKDANDKPLTGHRHTEFLAWCTDGGPPTRMLVWRGARAFDADEQEAILLAAARDVSWAATGSDSEEWKVRLVPLDQDVPPPPAFDGKSSNVWESVTPYVPPRHHLRGSKEREGESLVDQIRREVQQRVTDHGVEVEVLGAPKWVSVHVPRRQAHTRAFIGDRRGQMIRLRFTTRVAGPIRLGHSSSFGLGLFRPVQETDEP